MLVILRFALRAKTAFGKSLRSKFDFFTNLPKGLIIKQIVSTAAVLSLTFFW
jgi:hypothetical protein